MINARKEPTTAWMLARIVTGDANYSEALATVQRSHRFPLHLFVQIENLARLGKVPVSLIINQLIECGLEAVKHELPEETAGQLTIYTKDQAERPTKTERVEIKGRNLPPRKKPKAGK